MQSKVTQAIDAKDLTSLQRYIDEGLDLNELDLDGRTPLMHAVLGDGGDPTVLQFLLGRGADPDIHDRLLGWTALHYAVRDQKIEMITVLLESGANPDEEDIFGDTPLWRCVTASAPSGAIMRMLINRGANPAKPHRIGISALDVAMSLEQSDVVAALCA